MTPAVSFARALVSSSLAAAAGLGTLAGCTTSAPSSPYTPITGIDIPSADLVIGHGCGNGAEGQQGKVYRYAAVVAYSDAGAGQGNDGGGGMVAHAVASGVFDCFADGIFSNLPQSDAGNLSFTIAIYAYNQCSFPPTLACATDTSAACPAEDPNVVAQSIAARPSNWTTTCTATQLPGVTVTADCLPLAPEDGEDGGSPCADASDE